MKQKLRIKDNNSSIVLNFIQIQILVLSEDLLIDKFRRIPVAYTTIYQKENNKNVCFGILFFHWLEKEQINKVLIKILNFDFSFKKENKPDKKSNLSYFGVESICYLC